MESSKIAELWVDKYRPTSLSEYVLNAKLKEYFAGMVSSRMLQSCTFAGIQGSGKTTLAKVLAKEFDAEVLFVRCATEGTVDVLRTKIAAFCNATSLEGKIKLVILDEIDSASASGTNSFQLALRNLIEQAQDDTRFILTCNTVGKVLPAILSRCPVIPLMFDQKDLLIFLKKILDAEKISYDKNSLKAFIDETFRFYPDCRRIIGYLQLCCNSGKLVVNLNQVTSGDKEEMLRQIVELARTATQMLDVRKCYLANKAKVGDYVVFGSELYNYVIDHDLVTDDGILILTEQMYELNMVVDKESYVFGMFVAIRKYAKGKA